MTKVIFSILIMVIITSCTPSVVSNSVSNENHGKIFSLTLDSIEGDTISVSSFKGNIPVFISFWATWCDPCKIELIKLNEIKEKYQGKIQFIGVAIDTEESLGKVREFVAENSITFPILIDPSNNTVSQILPGGDTVPYGLLLDKNGNVVHKQSGYEPGDEKKLESLFEKLLEN